MREPERPASWPVRVSWAGAIAFGLGTLLPETRTYGQTHTTVLLDDSLWAFLWSALLPWGMAALAAIATWRHSRGSRIGSGAWLGAGMVLSALYVPAVIYAGVLAPGASDAPPNTLLIGGVLEVAGALAILWASVIASRPRLVSISPARPAALLVLAGTGAIVAGAFLPYETLPPETFGSIPGVYLPFEAGNVYVEGTSSLVDLRLRPRITRTILPLLALLSVVACTLPVGIAALRGRGDERLIGLAASSAAATALLFGAGLAVTLWRGWTPEIGAWLALGGAAAVGLGSWITPD